MLARPHRYSFAFSSPPSFSFTVSGAGYAPVGHIYRTGPSLSLDDPEALPPPTTHAATPSALAPTPSAHHVPLPLPPPPHPDLRHPSPNVGASRMLIEGAAAGGVPEGAAGIGSALGLVPSPGLRMRRPAPSPLAGSPTAQPGTSHKAPVEAVSVGPPPPPPLPERVNPLQQPPPETAPSRGGEGEVVAGSEPARRGRRDKRKRKGTGLLRRLMRAPPSPPPALPMAQLPTEPAAGTAVAAGAALLGPAGIGPISGSPVGVGPALVKSAGGLGEATCLQELALAGALCNDATLSQREDEQWMLQGDPTGLRG